MRPRFIPAAALWRSSYGDPPVSAYACSAATFNPSFSGGDDARESAPRLLITVAAMRSLGLGCRVYLQKDIENWLDMSLCRAHHEVVWPPHREACDVV